MTDTNTQGGDVREYRKKPVKVSAFALVDANAMRRAAKWCGGRYLYESKASDHDDTYFWVDIPTLEGVMRASLGDFIIRGVEGEFYPCKPGIFKATYEEVPADV